MVLSMKSAIEYSAIYASWLC